MAAVAILGGGVMGLATAWRLAERGHEVRVYEARSVGHPGGSSHGRTRVFRTAYDHPAYAAMALAALPLWRELEEEGTPLLRVTGGIDLGDEAALSRCAEAMAAGGAQAEWLEPEQIRERFAWLRPSGRGLYSPDAGVIDAAATVRILADRARAAGATIVEGARAAIEDASERGVALRVKDERVNADACVVTAGAWVPRLSPVAFPVSVTEEQVFYVDGPAGVVPVIWRAQRFFYTVPPFTASGTMKVGEHGAGPPVDPDRPRARVDPARAAPLGSWLAQTIPAAGPLETDGESCLYTTTPDEHFVIDRQGAIVIGSPCSGHGFKFAPLIGEALACLATGREPPFDLAPFSLGRF